MALEGAGVRFSFFGFGLRDDSRIAIPYKKGRIMAIEGYEISDSSRRIGEIRCRGAMDGARTRRRSYP